MLLIWIDCLVPRFGEPLKRVGTLLTKAACGWFILVVHSAFGWATKHVKVLSGASFMAL